MLRKKKRSSQLQLFVQPTVKFPEGCYAIQRKLIDLNAARHSISWLQFKVGHSWEEDFTLHAVPCIKLLEFLLYITE